MCLYKTNLWVANTKEAMKIMDTTKLRVTLMRKGGK